MNRQSDCPSFGFGQRLARVCWRSIWFTFAFWTPRQLNFWRLWLLRMFGARIGNGVDIRSTVSIWWPGNLTMEDGSTLGPNVICYNMGPILIGCGAVISQRAELCTGSHEIDDESFALLTAPIVIGPKAWVAANAFVGPGVRIGEGAVLGACAVTFSDLAPWTVNAGNPARKIRSRRQF